MDVKQIWDDDTDTDTVTQMTAVMTDAYKNTLMQMFTAYIHI